MNRRPSPFPSSLEPLPAEFAPALCEIDACLHDAARSAPVPAGLADRVFAASVDALAPSSAVEAAPRLRFIPAPRQPLHQLRWARLAMAACLAIVCGAAIWLLNTTVSAPERSIVARNGASADHLFESLELAQPGAISHLEADIEYLLHTHELTREEFEREVTTLASLF